MVPEVSRPFIGIVLYRAIRFTAVLPKYGGISKESSSECYNI
jgi:hypothetical protein